MKKTGMTVLLLFYLVQFARADDALNRGLFEAISAGNAQEVQALISRGADVSVALSEIKGKINTNDLLPVMTTPLGYALSRKNKEISRLLARNMVRFAVPFTWGTGGKGTKFELQTTVFYDDIEITEILLQRGASIAEADPTFLFSRASSIAMADFLLAHGGNANAKDANGASALHMIARDSSLKAPVAEWLLAHGADINAGDIEGRTPLHHAVLQCLPMNVKFLLEHGAEVNAKDNRGETPLHSMGSPDRFTYGYTYKNETKQLVEVLLAHGADVNAKDKDGLTPLGRVTATADQDLIKALQSHGGKTNVGPRVLFQQSLTQFKGHSENETLRTAIIELALKLEPAPASPPEAEAAAGRAAYIFKNSKSEDDTLNAAREYLKAIEAAPWVANYYYNLCTVLEKTPYTQQALNACKLYQIAAPNAADAADMQQRIAGIKYAVDKNKEQIKQRTKYLGSSEIEDLYRFGGMSGKVAGKDAAIKLVVDWQASPPRYQVFAACIEGDHVQGRAYDLVSTDTWDTLCKTGFHIVIKPEGAGFVELSGGGGSLRATLDELFQRKQKALEQSPIFKDSGDDKEMRFYVTYVQGGRDNKYSGYAMYESDCNGNLLRQDPRALPDDFSSQESRRIKEHFRVLTNFENKPQSWCNDKFWGKTGLDFREKE